MNVYFGPMEGVTTVQFRRIHAAMFPGADRYYMPFISPTADHRFTARELREITPENNLPARAVPQILSKSAEDFLWCAAGLADMGYDEVNLNIGCPSATVTAKGKGSALLRAWDSLERLLDGIFAGTKTAVSVKTRIGWADPSEAERLFELFLRYPIAELILHCRTAREMYSGTPHTEAFVLAKETLSCPLCYNGDLFTAEDVSAFEKDWPGTGAVMLCRGAARDPALFRRIRGGGAASREELRAFHETLYEEYRSAYGHLNGMRRMKELWGYLLHCFEDTDDVRKTMMRTKDTDVFDECVERVFTHCPLADGKPL